MSGKIVCLFMTNVVLGITVAYTGKAMAQTAPATNYQGADAILRQAAESSNQSKSKEGKPSPAAQLRAGGALAIEGTQGDVSALHARRGFGQGEEERLVEQADEQER